MTNSSRIGDENFMLKPLDFVSELKSIGVLERGYSDLISCYCKANPDTLKFGHRNLGSGEPKALLAQVVYISFGKTIIHYDQLSTKQIIFKLNKPNNEALQADYGKLLEKPFRLIIDCALKRYKGNAYMSSHVIPINNVDAFYDYIVKHNIIDMKTSNQYLANNEPEEIIPNE